MILTGTVLKDGLAGWVMRHRRIGLIADTEKDDRWFNLPDQPYAVRSAMAVPIIRDDEMLGILTLLHPQPGIFHQGTVDVMEVTAGQLGLALESAKLYSKLDQYSRALDAELEKGRQIQKEFLPRELPRLPGWDLAACFHPARQVAGDFYDEFVLPNGCLAVVIGDVCDKGVGSALFMALIRSLIRVFTGKISLSGCPFSPASGPPRRKWMWKSKPPWERSHRPTNTSPTNTATRGCLRRFAWGSSTRRPGCWHTSTPGICRS